MGTSRAPGGVPKNVRVSSLREQVDAGDEPPPPITKPERPRRSVRSTLWRWTKRAAVAGVLLLLCAVGAFFATVRHYEADLPSVADLRTYHPPQVTRVLAKDGTVLAELFTERRTKVPIDELPAHVKLAFLAAEDASFYEHAGLNYWGIARALLVNLRHGRAAQGGSTITQQVVKNLLLDGEKSFRRKAREALLSRRLEQELTKDEILELYLNHIYLGHGRYGVEEASKDLFGKSAKEMSLGEAALLGGLPKNPENYSPRKDVERAIQRRIFVLDQMRAKGFINGAQLDAAKAEPVRLAPIVDAHAELAPEVVSYARKLLQDLEPDRAGLGGFTIQTTIDPKLQAAARKSLRDALLAYDKRHALTGALHPPPESPKGRAPKKDTAVFDGTPSFASHKVYTGVVLSADDAHGTFDVRIGTATGTVRLSDYERYNPQKLAPSAYAVVGARVRVSLLAPLAAEAPGKDAAAKVATSVPLRLEQGPEGAFVALDVRSRHVLALVGNYEAVAGSLDRATQSKRQPGSTFKPVVYSYAIHSRRYTPASLIDVTPRSFGTYKPANYEGWKGVDALRLREALANSVNIAAVQVLDDVGPASVVEWGHALGIQSTLKPDLSLALGSYEVEPIELASAYATFAAGGVYEPWRLVTKIVGPDGKEVPLPDPGPSRRVLDEAEAFVITSMMTSVIDHGTGVRAKELRRPVAGKTGTSNQSKDTWFAGFSTDVAAVAWIGFDDGKPLGGTETGGGTALPAWIGFMRAAHEGKPATDFARPAGVVTVKIDPRTGKLATPDATDAMDEVFLQGTEPTETAPSPLPEGGLDAASSANLPSADAGSSGGPASVPDPEADLPGAL